MLLSLIPLSLVVAVLFSCPEAVQARAVVTPTDGMVIRTSCTLRPGTYRLPRGVSIAADRVSVEAHGVTFVGSFSRNSSATPSVGLTVTGVDDVKVVGLRARGYFYGVAAFNVSRFSLAEADLSDNYVDPESHKSKPPWLNIFCKPDDWTTDRTNFGGGLLLWRVSKASVSDVRAENGENGIDAFNIEHSVIQGCTLSNQTGWGIHLFESSHNKILNNVADNCTRANLGDSSGLLLACSCSFNHIEGNSFKYGGDGVYLAWTPSGQGPHPTCCSNTHNLLVQNDASFAGANAFEADFSWHNEFRQNTASGSNFGFWLGYSRFCHVSENIIEFNHWNGIAIDHGQDNVIENNQITDNAAPKSARSPLTRPTWRPSYERFASAQPQVGEYPPPWQQNGVFLWSDLTDPYPVDKFTCLTGYDHKPSRNCMCHCSLTCFLLPPLPLSWALALTLRQTLLAATCSTRTDTVAIRSATPYLFRTPPLRSSSTTSLARTTPCRTLRKRLAGLTTATGLRSHPFRRQTPSAARFAARKYCV
jgi:parallel beta-helix repeat protein